MRSEVDLGKGHFWRASKSAMDHQGADDDPNDPFSTAGKSSLDSLTFEDPSWGVQAPMASSSSFGNFQDTGLSGRDLDVGNGKFGDFSPHTEESLPTFDPGKTNPFDFLEAGLKEDRKEATKEGKAVWYEGWDEVHKCYYYFNEITKESRWTKPDEPVVGYGEEAEDEDGEEDEEDEGEENEEEEEVEEYGGEGGRGSEIDESAWCPSAVSQLSISSPPPAPHSTVTSNLLPPAPNLSIPLSSTPPPSSSALSPSVPASTSEPSPLLKKEMAKKEALLCSLTGCGIGRANEALRRHKGDANAAADWLLTNPVIEEPAEGAGNGDIVVPASGAATFSPSLSSDSNNSRIFDIGQPVGSTPRAEFEVRRGRVSTRVM